MSSNNDETIVVDKNNYIIPSGLKISPYDYQIESFKHCVNNNTLLVLATGMGKTLISILTLIELKKRYENNNTDSQRKKIGLFLVDRIPLVVQQAEAISEINGLVTLQCYGEITDNEKKTEIKEMNYDVLVATAQSLINLLKSSHMSMENIYFLVFDEVHHAENEHPFIDVMSYVNFLPFTNRPRILGMSASICSEDSVGKNIDRIKSIEQKMNSQVFRPTLLLSYNTQKNEIIAFESYFQEQVLSDKLEAIVKSLVYQFTKKEEINDVDLDDITDHNKYLHGLRKLANKFKESKQYTGVIGLIMKMYEVLTIIKVQGVKKALIELDSRLEGLNIKKEVMYSIYNSLNIKSPQDPTVKEFSSRYTKFQEIFTKTYQEFINSNSNSNSNSLDEVTSQFRSIVFVDTRDAADKLMSLMTIDENFFSKLNPKLFVGHGGNDGMTSHEQQTMISQFKSGICKLLVATNVLEEGLDIKDCNLVICYDGIVNLRSLIQKRGRARSILNSKFYILTNKEHVDNIEKVIKKEVTMILAITKLVNEREQKSRNIDLVANLKDFNLQSILDSGSSNDINKVFFISLYHVDVDVDDFEDDISTILYESLDYKLLLVKKVFLPSNEEFMQKTYFLALEYIGNKKDITIHQMIDEVLGFLSPYGWWAKIPTHLDTSINNNKLHIDSIASNNLLDSKTTNSSLPRIIFDNNSIGKQRNLILDLSIHSLELGNFYHPNRFTKSKNFNITNIKTARFYMYKREFQIRHDDRTYFFSLTDLHPYCIFVHNQNNNSDRPNHLNDSSKFSLKLLQFYLLLIRPGKISRKPNQEKPSTIKSHPPIDLQDVYGRSFVYKFSFFLRQEEIDNLKSKFNRFGFELFHGNISMSEEPKPINYDEIKHSGLQYLFECLKTNKTFGKPYYTQEFVNKIQKICSSKQIEKAIFILKESIQNKILFYDLSRLFHDLKDRLEIFSQSIITSKSDHDNSNLIEVKLVIMTPSRTTFQPPTLIAANRVIRRFDPNRFLLFHFQDDRNQKLAYLGPDLKILLENFIVKSGITVCDSAFKFLGGSQSQMKNIGCWLYNDYDTSFSTHKVREWMGDIPKLPRKFLRSMGILFSSTFPVKQIANNQIMIIKEYESRSQFTEGCGTIGMDLVEEINRNNGFPAKTCSFQIRFGGYKGVVSKDPNPIYKDKLRLRDSMKKFETSTEICHRTLEIISISTAKTCHLSRPLITLLSGIGAKDSYFLNLFHNTLTLLTKPLNNIEAAKKQLSAHFPGVTSYELLTDSYLKRIQILYYKKQLGDLQQRFNIEISQSRNLLGIADETQTLGPNQVFINVTERVEGSEFIRKVITGRVGVTRNPSTHPGDIRFLEAVQNSKLEEHYSDVIVFSVKGQVPSFKESSGGDLDGDRYFVFYDSELLTDCIQQSPSGFEDMKSPQEEEDRDILGNETLGKQFCQNLQRSYIGDIATDHLAICDSLGVNSEYSLILSEQHFKEVDVLKHGEHACIPQPIKKYLNSIGYPHFMKKGHESKKVYYKSKKVLGIMYDQCRQLDFIGDQIPDIGINKELIIPGSEIFESNAREQYIIYKNRIHNLLKRHNAKTEEELTLGFFENPVTNYIHTNDSKENANTQFKRIREEYITLFLSQFSEPNLLTQEDTLSKYGSEIEKKISAWYKVAYSDNEENRTLSFYWNVKHLQKKVEIDSELEKHTLTRSIYDYFLSEMQNNIKQKYIEKYEILLILNNQIKKSVHLRGSKLDFIGSTTLLLFDDNSDLNLIYTDDNSNKTPTERNQERFLDRLSMDLENLECITEKSYDKLQKSIKFQVKNIPVTICMDISFYDSYRIYLAYVEKNPFLLPFLLILIKWAKSSYLIESDSFEFEKSNRKKKIKEQDIEYLTVPMLIDITIHYCITQNLVQLLNEQSILERALPTAREWSFWDNLISLDLGKQTIGQKILDFLNFNNKYLLDRLFPTKNNRNYSPKNLEKSSKSTMQFYQETFLVGYHSLSHSQNVCQFFENCTIMKKTCYPIKDRNLFLAKFDELRMKLGLLMHFNYTIQPNLLKPKNIYLEGNSRTLSEATNIIRSVLLNKTS